MNIAYAANNASFGGGFATLLPLLLLECIMAFLFRSIAKRKGKNQWLWFFAAFVPFWNGLGGLWLVSLPEKVVLDSIKELVDEFGKLKGIVPKSSKDGPSSSLQQTWKCDCGIANDMNINSCPQCGLKRDYLLKRGG